MRPLEGTPFSWQAQDDQVIIERRPPPWAAPLFWALLAGYAVMAAWGLWGARQPGAERRDELLWVAALFGLCTFVAVAMAWLRGYPRRLVVRTEVIEVHPRLGSHREEPLLDAHVKLAIDEHDHHTDVAVELTTGGGKARPLVHGRDVDLTDFRALAAALRGVLGR